MPLVDALGCECPEDRGCDFALWVPGILAQKRELAGGELASEGQISKSRESENFFSSRFQRQNGSGGPEDPTVRL